MSVTTAHGPFTFAGIPTASWAFAVRVWIAVVVALYASFWLQLEAASSAAITVAILALPTRGQALEKAGFRLAATVIGVAASIAIVGLFSQARDLLLLAFAAWLGLCVYAANLADGNRAYAAVLSGYTVALVAIQQIDTPQQVFESGVARGAAIVVGVAAVAIVNGLLAAPDRYLGLEGQLAALHRRLRDQAKAVIRGQAVDAAAMVALLREIAALRSDLTSLVTESSTGSARATAARNAAVALVAALHAVRTLKTIRDRQPSMVSFASGQTDERGEQTMMTAARAWAATEVLRRDRDVRECLAALDSGSRPTHAWRAPLFRSHRIAAEAALRAAVWLALTAGCLVLAGWPAAEASLSLVVVMIGLGATTPDPRRFTMTALLATPMAAILAAIFEFLVLDGASAFPVLAIALAPFVMGATILMALPSPLPSALGRLSLIFMLAIVGLSNAQAYDPQAFLFTSLFIFLGAALVFAAQLLVPPVSDRHRCKCLMASARRELGRLPSRKSRRHAPEEAMFRDAMRITKIAEAGVGDRPHRAIQEQALSLFDQAGSIRLCEAALARMTARTANGPSAERARRALAARNARLVREAAFELRDATASAALFVASRVIGAAPVLAEEARA